MRVTHIGWALYVREQGYKYKEILSRRYLRLLTSTVFNTGWQAMGTGNMCPHGCVIAFQLVNTALT